MSNLTKRAIQASFVKLLNQKTLDKITVKDIVEDCGINRNTFYYHYQDVYALLQDVFESEITSGDLSSINADNWKDSFSKAINFALQNKKAVYHVFNSSHREMLERYLWEVSASYTKDFVLAQARGLDIAPVDLEYVTVFYKHAFMGIVEEWLARDMKNDPIEGIEHFGRIFEGSMRAILEKIAKK